MNENIVKKIIDASNKIADVSRNGVSSYMICSQYIANAIFEIDKVKARKAKIKRLLSNGERNKS